MPTLMLQFSTLQALEALVDGSRVSKEYIMAKQKEGEPSDDDSSDDELALTDKETASKVRTSNQFRMLSGIIDPIRRVLSAGTTLYPKRLQDGTPDLVRRFLKLPRSRALLLCVLCARSRVVFRAACQQLKLQMLGSLLPVCFALRGNDRGGRGVGFHDHDGRHP
jgi:hypothetical protein